MQPRDTPADLPEIPHDGVTERMVAQGLELPTHLQLHDGTLGDHVELLP